jgi:uncharacterized tellurite resistance protein B-like protein
MRGTAGESERLGILRVLVSVAWADGVVSPAELGYIQDLCGRFGLVPGEREEILALTRTPLGWEDFQNQLRALDDLRRDPASREELMRRIEGLVALDQVRTPEEARHLAFLRAWASSETSDPSSTLPWRGLWRAARTRIGTLGERLAPGSLAAVLDQMARAKLPALTGPDSPPQRRHLAMLFGALIYRVIKADREVRPEELGFLRRLLEEEQGFSAGESEQMLALIEKEMAAEADRQHLCAEFNRITEMEERLRLLQTLFAVGLADGRLSPEEEEEIRLIANFLWIETQEFVRIRLLALGKSPDPV